MPLSGSHRSPADDSTGASGGLEARRAAPKQPPLPGSDQHESIGSTSNPMPETAEVRRSDAGLGLPAGHLLPGAWGPWPAAPRATAPGPFACRCIGAVLARLAEPADRTAVAGGSRRAVQGRVGARAHRSACQTRATGRAFRSTSQRFCTRRRLPAACDEYEDPAKRLRSTWTGTVTGRAAPAGVVRGARPEARRPPPRWILLRRGLGRADRAAGNLLAALAPLPARSEDATA
jgi:hypothetical protein